MRPAFGALAAVCAQSEADANRIAALGAHKVSVCGNLKFDVQLDDRLLEAGRELRKLMAGKGVIALASTLKSVYIFRYESHASGHRALRSSCQRPAGKPAAARSALNTPP